MSSNKDLSDTATRLLYEEQTISDNLEVSRLQVQCSIWLV